MRHFNLQRICFDRYVTNVDRLCPFPEQTLHIANMSHQGLDHCCFYNERRVHPTPIWCVKCCSRKISSTTWYIEEVILRSLRCHENPDSVFRVRFITSESVIANIPPETILDICWITLPNQECDTSIFVYMFVLICERVCVISPDNHLLYILPKCAPLGDDKGWVGKVLGRTS